MNELAAWGPTLVAMVVGFYTAGQVVGRVKSQEVLLKEHNDRLDGHDVDIKGISDRQARVEAWREGYAAGSKSHNGQG